MARSTKRRTVSRRIPTPVAIEFLKAWPEATVRKQLIRRAPDDVIKTIANAALNVARGDVQLTPPQKKLLSKYRGVIERLTQKGKSVRYRRKYLLQKGGQLGFLPLLLSTAISTIGSAILPKLFGKSE